MCWLQNCTLLGKHTWLCSRNQFLSPLGKQQPACRKVHEVKSWGTEGGGVLVGLFFLQEALVSTAIATVTKIMANTE